jgi:hypothetical protein
MRGLHTNLWASKNRKNPETKWHLGIGSVATHMIYYKGEGGGFPQVRAMVSIVSPCLLVAHPCTKDVLARINITRNSVICNHHVCNWDATTGHMQLYKVFYATTMDFCPLFGYATMVQLWSSSSQPLDDFYDILLYIFDMHILIVACATKMVFW